MTTVARGARRIAPEMPLCRASIAFDRPARSRQPRILLVEDEPAISGSLTRFLNARGYVVDRAEDVETALAVLEWCTIDAVILDILLAPPSCRAECGLDVLTTIRQRPGLAGLPVVILTGVPLDDAMRAVIARHGAAVFCKPENYATIARYLEGVIHRIPTSGT
jgi:DNA-binding response OmpR family regulator